MLGVWVLVKCVADILCKTGYDKFI